MFNWFSKPDPKGKPHKLLTFYRNSLQYYLFKFLKSK